MKITKEKLKTLIKEELDAMLQLETLSTSSLDAASDASAPRAGGPTEEEKEHLEKVSALKSVLVGLAQNLGGVQTAELPVLKVAVDLIDKARSGNVNVGNLVTHLKMVATDLEKI